MITLWLIDGDEDGRYQWAKILNGLDYEFRIVEFESVTQALERSGSPDYIFIDLSSATGISPGADVGVLSFNLSRHLVERHPGAIFIVWSAVSVYVDDFADCARETFGDEAIVEPLKCREFIYTKSAPGELDEIFRKYEVKGEKSDV